MMKPVSTLVPQVSVMGLFGPKGLRSVNVASGLMPTHSIHRNSPAIRFQNFALAVGLKDESILPEHHQSYRVLDRFEVTDASSALVRLADSMFPLDKSMAASRSDLIDMGIEALSKAEPRKIWSGRDFSDSVAKPGAQDEKWFTGAGLFLNVNGDEGAKLIAMYAVGRAGLADFGADIMGTVSAFFSNVQREEDGSYARAN